MGTYHRKYVSVLMVLLCYPRGSLIGRISIVELTYEIAAGAAAGRLTLIAPLYSGLAVLSRKPN
jgi:hypothetical protein